MKQLGSIILLLSFLVSISGCATFEKIDRLPLGLAKGYVEFYLDHPTDAGIHILEVLPDGTQVPYNNYTLVKGWGSVYPERVRVALTPGIHEFIFYKEYNSSAPRIKVEIVEEMLIPVRISLTEIIPDHYRVFITPESPISIQEYEKLQDQK